MSIQESEIDFFEGLLKFKLTTIKETVITRTHVLTKYVGHNKSLNPVQAILVNVLIIKKLQHISL